MDNNSQNEILVKVQEIIADTTGNELGDIHADTHFEDELGITPVDFKRIIAEINKEFEIDLDAQDLMEDEVATALELAIIVREEAILS